MIRAYIIPALGVLLIFLGITFFQRSILKHIAETYNPSVKPKWFNRADYTNVWGLLPTMMGLQFLLGRFIEPKENYYWYHPSLFTLGVLAKRFIFDRLLLMGEIKIDLEELKKSQEAENQK